MGQVPPGFVPYIDATLSRDGLQQGGLARAVLTHEEGDGFSERQFGRFLENRDVEGIDSMSG